VIPTPLARGAQREARALADRLDAPGRRAHRVLALFEGPNQVRTDYSLRFDGGDRPAVGYDPRLMLRLRAAIQGHDPAVVVAHGSDPLKYVVPALLGRRRRPLAYYAIGTYAGARGRLQLLMWRQLMARVNVVAAEGYEVQAECTELLGVPAERVFMTPNGRDPQEFFPRAPDRPARPRLIFVGALAEGKRPDRFVEIVGRLRSRGLDFDAELVGDGAMRRLLVGPAGDAGVTLLGARSDVAELLRAADVMVFTSRAAGEGMPGVLIEAGLSGLPVVATRVPGVTTIVDDGRTGLVIDQDDLAGMVTATASLLEDAGLRTAMGAAARERCASTFSLDAVAEVWLKVLGPLLPGEDSGRPGAPPRSSSRR
jgi:glycosyltransferase involved in cell wall biosynthesis